MHQCPLEFGKFVFDSGFNWSSIYKWLPLLGISAVSCRNLIRIGQQNWCDDGVGFCHKIFFWSIIFDCSFPRTNPLWRILELLASESSWKFYWKRVCWLTLQPRFEISFIFTGSSGVQVSKTSSRHLHNLISVWFNTFWSIDFCFLISEWQLVE